MSLHGVSSSSGGEGGDNEYYNNLTRLQGHYDREIAIMPALLYGEWWW